MQSFLGSFINRSFVSKFFAFSYVHAKYKCPFEILKKPLQNIEKFKKISPFEATLLVLDNINVA